MDPDLKGRGAPGWQAGSSSWSNLVIVHESPRGSSPLPSPPMLPKVEGIPMASARGLALESLRITSSSTSASSRSTQLSQFQLSPANRVSPVPGALGGREVLKLERKSEVADSQVRRDPPAAGTPVRSLRALGVASPEMSRFLSLSRHLPALPLARDAAAKEEGGSDGLLRRDLARVLTQARLHVGDEPTLAQACTRLLGVQGFSPALMGLAAGAMALELDGRNMPQSDREHLVDAILKEALREREGDAGLQSAVVILEGLCEVFHGTGHWMPQSAPFVRMVLDRLVMRPSSSQCLALLRALTTRMLLVAPATQLHGFLGQLLDQPFLTVQERSSRLLALVGGLADKTSPAPNDAHLGPILQQVLQGDYPEANVIAFTRALAQHTVLWEQACQPHLLEPADFGRLLLARTGIGCQDDKASVAGRMHASKLAASSTTTRSPGVVETKAGPVRTAPAAVDRVAQVLGLSLSLGEGAEGRLAREIVAIHRAVEGAPDAVEARETLKTCILLAAPDALMLSAAAMACGWGIAVGADTMSEEAFATLCASFKLASTGDASAWAADGYLTMGLVAARDLHGLMPTMVPDPEERAWLVRMCREARGGLGDERFAAELMLQSQLKEVPLDAATWLDELVRRFTGSDFDLLVTARSYLLDYAQALLAEDAFAAAFGLNQMAVYAGRIQEAAYRVVSQRYDQCLWMTDTGERKALLALVRRAVDFLDEDRAIYLDRQCVLPLSASQHVALANYRLNLQGAIQRLVPPSDLEPPRSLAGLSVAVGKGQEKGGQAVNDKGKDRS